MVVDSLRRPEASEASASTAVRVLRGVGMLVLVAVAVLTLVVLAPFALHERTPTGSVADTAVDLPGQAHQATIGLRGLGFSCSDAVTTTETVTRSCTRVRNLSTSQVQLVATADTGLIQLVQSNVGEEWRDRAPVHGDILGVVSRAIGLSPQEQEQVAAAAAATTAESVLDLGWGTAVVVTGLGQPGPASTFRAAGQPGPGLQPSPTTLAISVDALATAARGARLHLHDSGGDVHSQLPTDRRRLSRRPLAAGHRHLHDLGGPGHQLRLPHSHP